MKMFRHLLNQTKLPDHIYLYIPATTLQKKTTEYERIRRYTKRYPIIILLNGVNHGKISSLYYTLKREMNANTYIIVVGDDVPYHPQMIRLLVRSHKKLGGAVGYKGWVLHNSTRKLPQTDVIESYAGMIFLRSAFFNEGTDTSDLLLKTAGVGKRYVDDILLNKSLAVGGVCRYVILDSGIDLQDPRPWGGSHAATANEKCTCEDKVHSSIKSLLKK